MIFYVNLSTFLAIRPFKACCFDEFPITLDIAYLNYIFIIFMTEVHVAICKLIYAYFTTEIILKQLFTSVSVIIGEYSPRLRLGEYSPIITSTSVNNC